MLFLQLSLAEKSNICILAGMISPNNSDVPVVCNQIRHIVCLKFRDGTKPEEIGLIEEKFPMLKNLIPGIISIEWGTNNSPEGLNKGFTHCFVVTFKGEDARSSYLPHPSHEAFVDILKPLLDDVFVIDYNL